MKIPFSSSVLKILILLIILLSNIISADVRYVSKTGSSQFPYTSWETAADSIPKCIKASNNMDTIYVANGVYKDSIYIDKEISLIGSSMDSTVIDGTGLGYSTIETQAKASINNFTIYGKAFNIGFAIVCYQPLNISSCKISNCATGISTIDVPCIMNKVIINNAGWGFGGGCFSDTCNYFISNSIILVNAQNSRAINTSVGGNYFINNNIIIYYGHNNPDYGITAGWPRRVEIKNNLVFGFSWNIFFDQLEDTAFITNNLIMNRLDRLNHGDGIYSQHDHLIVKNNIFDNNLYSFSGSPPYVNLDYNLYWHNSFDLYGINYGNNDIVADPMFIKDTLPTPLFNFDYHLQAFSPAINKGDPSILNKDGSSDIGMFGGPYGEVYKFEDLAPRPPKNLTTSVDSNKITLKWNRNTEADTAYYNIYRDTSANFIIDTTKLVSKIKDTLFIQTMPAHGKYLYYKLTAVDKQSNVSQPSEEIKIIVTSITKSPQIINDYKLYQNYPNPFNPTTLISYRLKEEGSVKLMVYNIKGELIKVLVNENKQAGYYETEFNAKGLASGIYLYRIEVIGKGNITIYTDMKKTILLK